MLSLCSTYAESHGIIFNTEKTQLICFRKYALPAPVDNFVFNGVRLKFSDNILHLGHLVSFDLNDKENIVMESLKMSIERLTLSRVHLVSPTLLC